MKTINKFFTLCLLVLVSLFSIAFAQNVTAKTIKVVVNGTSPMHNWVMNSSGGSFTATAKDNVLNDLKFTMPAKNLKSIKGEMMDNKAYAALKADKFPEISFTATSLNLGKSNLTGKLTIAGVTKNVSIATTVFPTGSAYNISGICQVKMSDFGMAAPSFMTIKTGDEVTVKVNIVTK